MATTTGAGLGRTEASPGRGHRGRPDTGRTCRTGTPQAATQVRVVRPCRGRRGSGSDVLSAELPRVLHGVRARRVRRVLCDHQCHRVAAHPADGPDERDLRDHPGRRTAATGQHQHRGRGPRVHRRDRRLHQHLRRVRRRRTHDRHVPEGRLMDTLYSLVQAAYIIAAVLFILSLAGLSHQRSARAGNMAGKIGMVLALAATITLSLLESDQNAGVTAGLIAAALLIGVVIGTRVARKVEMTHMPELIAILHSFVGVAAVLVGFNSYLTEESADTIHLIEVFLGVFIGAVTFTGSIIAYLKLSAKMKSSPLTLPGRNLLNLGALIVSAGLLAWYLAAPSIWPLLIMTVIALVLGLHLVAAIGGGDMPVVVSMLNSYSGWAAAAAGFMLSNNLLIITGALVGSSGAILSYIMCKAMNRSFIAVILGGFGTETVASTGDQDLGEYHETSTAALAELLEESQSVVIA